MNKNNHIAAIYAGAIFGVLVCAWVSCSRINASHSYVKQLEDGQVDLKIQLLQKDIDYLTKEDCKSILITAINSENQVKEAVFSATGSIGTQRYITVVIDGVTKSYDYKVFMSTVFKVECADNYKW